MVVGFGGAALAPEFVEGAFDVVPPERMPAPKPRALPASGAVEALDVALPECPRGEDPRVAPNGIPISRQFAPAGHLSP